MIKRIAPFLLAILGISIGMGLASLTLTIFEGFGIMEKSNRAWDLVSIIVYVSGILIGLLGAVIFSTPAIRGMLRLISFFEMKMQNTEAASILFGSIGMVVGLLIAYLVTSLFRDLLSWVGFLLSVVVYIVLGYLGLIFGAKRYSELPDWLHLAKKTPLATTQSEEHSGVSLMPKVLDTSVIIDGRILEIVRIGFLEGPLIVTDYVLEELRHIADASDAMRRNRGRRGLDILSELQHEKQIEVRVLQSDPTDIGEVDVKLLKLAQQIGAKVVTNDYNLNKVAEVFGIGVLNINELSNAVKPVMLPGEELMVQVQKPGKDPTQGVAYLEDGTMIVIENGREFIGESLPVLVTSVLQTAAGRMIFAKHKIAG